MTAAFNDDYEPPVDPRTTAELVDAGELDSGKDWNTYPSPGQPMATARRLMSDLFTTSDGRALVRWRGDWWRYNGNCWDLLDDELDVKEHLWNRLEKVVYLDKDHSERPWAPTTSKVHGLMEPLAILARIPGHLNSPTWITPAKDYPSAARLVSTGNGLLDLATRTLHPHTPKLFSTWALDFDYDPDATCPTWERFLGEVFAHDPAGAELLQEYAGYLVSGRTDMHKALLIVGPRRGGKGTISRIIQQLVGTANAVSPSLGTLGSEFGLAGLIGKPLAVVEDARADDDRRMNTTVERLLNIIGEDAIAVNRKNIDFWHGTLPTRLLVVSNETPRFLDSSGAITSRFMSVRLQASFESNPDTGLGRKLRGELPGIFTWALDGLARLEQQGRFTRPATMDEMHDLMADLASPMQKFLDENYIVTGEENDRLTVSSAHSEFKLWCEQEGLKIVNRDTFVQRVVSTEPRIKFKNTAVDGEPKTRQLFGLKVNPIGFLS